MLVPMTQGPIFYCADAALGIFQTALFCLLSERQNSSSVILKSVTSKSSVY